ncbi:MAG: HAMP domain-containing sensor histidine kinase [Burkholderiales bacterium]
MKTVRELLRRLSVTSRILLLSAAAIAVIAALTFYIDSSFDSPSAFSSGGEEVRGAARRNISVALTLALLLIAAIAFIFARGLSKRLAPLMQMANKALRGEVLNPIVIAGSDEIARLGSAFNRLAEELAERDRSTEEFLALAGNKLYAPTLAVREKLKQSLDAGDLDDDQAIVEAYENSQKQLAFVDNLTQAVECDLGRVSLSRSSIDLYRLTDEVVAELQPVIDSRGQRIAIIDPGHPILLLLDAAKMRSVLRNLITNASQWTQESGRIDVALNDYGSYATISVRDSGIGIAPEDLKKLFKKFSRLSKDSEGAGLGLYVANAIVKLHGGGIRAESEPGKGARFTIQVPKDS